MHYHTQRFIQAPAFARYTLRTEPPPSPVPAEALLSLICNREKQDFECGSLPGLWAVVFP